MKCTHIKKYLPLYAGNDLNPVIGWLISRHLKQCVSCRTELHELHQIKKMTADSVRNPDIKIKDQEIWSKILYQLPEKNTVQLQSKNKRAGLYRKLVPGIIGLAIVIIVIFFNKHGIIKKHSLASPVVENSRVPVVENIKDPDVTVMTFKTNDPDITIVWFFKHEPKS